MKNVQYRQGTDWNDVFFRWKQEEGSDPVWQKFAKEEKGWDSWDEWRGYQANLIGAKEREWSIYEIQKPNETIPEFLLGPYNGWQKHYPLEEAHTHTVADLVRDHTAWVKENVGVQARAAQFPQQAQMIGVYAEDEDRIILYEGHHRAAAIALRVFEGDPIVFETNLTIAITNMSSEDVKNFRNTLDVSTHKKNRN